jgi:acyl homoserine lactone synthase
MIEAFSLKTGHLFQDALASQARLRYKVFVEGRGLQHSFFDGLEYDEFDTPAAVYLVWRDDQRIVRGVARLLRTTRPYMLQSYWPFLLEKMDPPCSAGIWEVTRVCVDKSFNPTIRQRIFPELLCAIHEYFSLHHIRGMIGVTRQHLLAHFLQNIKWLGPAQVIEGEKERAFFVPTEHIRPHRHCEKLAISGPVICLPEQVRIAA